MGMFDYINCNYKLPEVDLSGTSLTQEDLRNGNQTKDLDNCLETYTIEEDGRISYVVYKDCEWVPPSKDATGFFARVGHVKRSDPETVYLPGNHIIEFGNYVQKDDDKFDYSWDWEVTVINGVVDMVAFKGLEKICNKDRKQRDIEYRAKNQKELEFRKTLRYRLLVKHIRSLRSAIRRKLINVIGFITNWIYKI
jgi:hypothetical protein